MNVQIKEGVKEIGFSTEYNYCDNQKIKSVKTPSTLEMIFKDCFSNCTNLTKVILNEGLRFIGKEAFSNTAIEEIEIPSTCKFINDKAFMDCKNLKSITFPEGIEEIKPFVCYGCENLEEIHFPSTLKNIAINSFENCPSIKRVTFEGSPEKAEAFRILINDMNSIDKKLEHFNTDKKRKNFNEKDLIKTERD